MLGLNVAVIFCVLSSWEEKKKKKVTSQQMPAHLVLSFKREPRGNASPTCLEVTVLK